MIERRTWTAIPGLIALAFGAVVLSAYSGASSSKNRSPVQPIKFPHTVHVGKLGMNCLYCHYTANKSPDPGLPAVSTCMGCHTLVGPKRPAVDGVAAHDSPEIKKLWQFAGLDTANVNKGMGEGMMGAGGAYGLGPNAKPIPWVRIHKVPEYVHFPHMRHVNAGVTCQTCHGQIQGMPQVYQFASLNMGWCVSCHVNGYTKEQGLEAAGYAAVATTPPAAADTVRKKARYDCANCHY